MINSVYGGTEIGRIKKSGILTGGIIFMTVLFACLIFGVQYAGMNSVKLIESGLIKDSFAKANLQAETSFSGLEFLTGVFLILGVISAYIFIKKSYCRRMISIFIVSMLFINMTILFIVPQIEKISQNAALEFYKERSKEDAYFITFHYKSYAQLFYGKVKQSESGLMPSPEDQHSGIIDKPVYAVCKNISEKEFAKRHKNFKRLYDKNGFVFWKRTD